MSQDPKSGFRFNFGGVNLTSVPDSLTPDKFSCALNIRAYSPQSIRTRTGYDLLFHCGNSAVTDVQSYTAIQTDNLPRYLARDSAGNVWLGPTSGNNATNVGNLAAPQGSGASMLPWRPSQSPQSWVYVASQNDYQKFSAPDANNNITQYKVGIAEPQVPVNAAPIAPAFTNFTANASNWTASGTASNTSNSNVLTDTAGTPISDPVIASRVSVPVAIPYYLIGSLINANNNAVTLEVQDVLPPVANCNITAIRYQSGNSGNCQIVCGPLPIGEGPTSPTILGALRRGAIVNLANGNTNENVLVLSATSGPSGAAMFECSTAATYAANNAIVGVRAIVVDGTIGAGQTITQPSVNSTIGSISGTVNTTSVNNAVTWVSGTQFTANLVGVSIIINSASYIVASVISATSLQLTTSPGIQSGVAYSVPSVGGVGTLSQTFATNPFRTQIGSSGAFPTPDDYVRLVVLVNNIAAFVELQIVFTTATYGTFTFTTNALQNLTAGELAIIEFPISALVPSGSNLSLADCTKVDVIVTTTGTQAFSLASFCLSGGGEPDIGTLGAPYQYQIIPRSTVTGAQGNPSPTMRYGVSPRRQNVLIPLPAVSSSLPTNDSQVDIWDIYRKGGSVDAYRYIASGAPATNFTDMYFDDTANAGALIPAQNFEPWPSVDVPWKVTAGGGVTITVTGAQIVVAGYSAWPATINNWLPGTLINLGGQAAYTLRRRPTLLSSTSYLFDLQEVAGSLSPSLLTINEPNVARQFAQYVWGPDASGYFFAVGDPLRPGVIYYATPNSPDITASTNTNEPSTPSEPLLNGAILNGLSFVASSDRWWRMFPTFQGSTVFTPFQVDIARGLAAPRGICSDKQNIYFVAKDGICATGGSGFQSLTDDDLFQLFPYEDVLGVDVVRNGVTWYAPDYSRAATFRMTHDNGWLKFYYQDSTGTPRTLVCFLKTRAWSQDQYANPMICETALVQPEGTLTTAPLENYGLAVMADNAGNVYVPSQTNGDNGASISCVLASFEWDGGNLRNSGLWESWYLDSIPLSGITANLVMFGAIQASIPATVIGASPSRQLTEIVVPDGSLNRFLGLQLAWTDAPGSAFTTLYTWRSFADPDSVYSWRTRFLTFGLHGYLHCGRLEPSYSANATVTLNLTSFDGTSAATMTLPSTGGNIQKILLTPSFNKGQMYKFSASSTAPFQIFLKDSILHLKQWGSKGPYLPYRLALEESVKP